MKRGSIMPEFIPKFIIELLPVILLLFILAGIYAIFIAEKPSQELQDFNRIIADIDNLLKQEGNYCLKTPIQAESGLNIFAFSKESTPKECQGDACICLYSSENKITRCETFPDADFKNQQISLKKGDKSVTISKSDDTILVGGPEAVCAVG